MQWLFDIVVEMMWDSIHALGIFRDVGSYAGLDFDHNDLTADNAWHELDLSALCDANAKGVSIRFKAHSITLPAVARFRPHGTTSSAHTCEFRTQISNLPYNSHFVLGVSTDKKIDYKLSNIVWADISMKIRASIL